MDLGGKFRGNEVENTGILKSTMPKGACLFFHSFIHSFHSTNIY